LDDCSKALKTTPFIDEFLGKREAVPDTCDPGKGHLKWG
jgi:hypothetical protein